MNGQWVIELEDMTRETPSRWKEVLSDLANQGAVFTSELFRHPLRARLRRL